MTIRRNTLAIVTAACALLIGLSELEAAELDDVIQVQSDGSFRPGSGTCSRSIDEHLAKHPELGEAVHMEDQYLLDGGSFRDYTAGSIYLHPTYRCAFAVRFGFWERWKRAGRQNSIYGYPVSDELATQPGRSRQYFDTGSMWWTQARGVAELHGGIATKHALLGLDAGFPIASQTRDRKSVV